MIRQTSKEAYKAVIESGWIGQKQREIYDHLYRYGPLTSGEAFDQINSGSAKKSLTQSRARFTELREMGIVYECGKRKCSVTGRTVITWDVTDRLPVKPPKKIKNKDKIERLKEAYYMLIPYAPEEIKAKVRRIIHGEEYD